MDRAKRGVFKVQVPGEAPWFELKLRGVDVLTSQVDSATQLEDAALLARATDLERVLFSQDQDLLKLGSQWQTSGKTFAGVIYAHQLRVSIGLCVTDLELIANATDPEEWVSRVEFLPL